MTTPIVNIERIGTETIDVPIIGTTPLIMHRFSEKAKRQMLDAQQGKKTPKQKRDPQAEYEASMHYTDDGYGFPVLGFKAATVGAARFFGKDVKMTELRQFIFMHGVPSKDRAEILVPVGGPYLDGTQQPAEPKMREDIVRLSMASTDLRYRGEFADWSATLVVTYVTSALSRDSVLSLIDAGGMGVGVGEWRPQKSGQNGTYAIDESRKVTVHQDEEK